MKNIIIPSFMVILILSIVAISGCTQSDVSSINELSSAINTSLKKGDEFFNKAVSDSNIHSLDNASLNANSALSEFNSAKNSAQQALNHAQNSKDNLFIEYIQNTVWEIDSRINATLELQQAIFYFKQKDSENGNTHVKLANQYMDKAIEYRTTKDSIIKQNPSKFRV